MNNLIRERRKVPFSFKRITNRTVILLCDIVDYEVSVTQELGSQYYLMYTVDAADHTSFESSSSKIFKDGGIIEGRIINKITMRFYTLDNSKSLEIRIMHSVKNPDFENFLTVSGNDSTWVNGILSRLVTVIDSAENQIRVNRNYKGLFLLALLALFNVEFFRLTAPFAAKNSNEFFNAVYILGIPAASIIATSRLSEYIDKVWPAIEVQAGPEHLNAALKRRNRLKWLIVSILLPIGLAIAYDFAKALL